MNAVWVNVAENDDQGNRSGYASVFRFGEIGSMWANDLKGLKFTHVKRKNDNLRFRIGRKEYYYSNYQSWSGTMIYNSYALSVVEACALLNNIYQSDKFHWEDVLIEVDEILSTDGVLMPGDFERLFNQ